MLSFSPQLRDHPLEHPEIVGLVQSLQFWKRMNKLWRVVNFWSPALECQSSLQSLHGCVDFDAEHCQDCKRNQALNKTYSSNYTSWAIQMTHAHLVRWMMESKDNGRWKSADRRWSIEERRIEEWSKHEKSEKVSTSDFLKPKYFRTNCNFLNETFLFSTQICTKHKV